MGVAEATRRDPGRERVLRLVDEARERRAKERDIDALAAPERRPASAFTTDERTEDADRAEHPRHDVADRDA